ncbi:hypothetical protein [Ideonella sp.]
MNTPLHFTALHPAFALGVACARGAMAGTGAVPRIRSRRSGS